MLRFIPIRRDTMTGGRVRAALAAARDRIKRTLGPGTEVGEISAGGFEVLTQDEGAEDQIRSAVADSAMKDEGDLALTIGSSGAIVPDQDPMDGSMIGL